MSKKLITIANTYSINTSILFDGEGILSGLVENQEYDIYELVFRKRIATNGTFNFSANNWTVLEQPEEENTRKLTIDIYDEPPAGWQYIYYKGQNVDGILNDGYYGNFEKISNGHYKALDNDQINTNDVFIKLFITTADLNPPIAYNIQNIHAVSTSKTFIPSGTPDSPSLSYSVDGETSTLTVTFGQYTINKGNGHNNISNWREVNQGRYRISDTSDYITFEVSNNLEITDLTQNYPLLFSWHNVNGWSQETQINPILSPPMYDDSAWDLLNERNTPGLIAILNSIPTPPAGWSYLRTEYRKNTANNGYETPSPLYSGGLISTDNPDNTEVQVRVVYDKGFSAWSNPKIKKAAKVPDTVTLTYDYGEVTIQGVEAHGQYPDGSYWVVGDAMFLLDWTPTSTAGRNGLQVQPAEGTVGTAKPQQGFDSRLTSDYPYNAALNVDPAISGSPLALTPGTTLMKAASHTDISPSRSNGGVQTYMLLTVLDAAPEAGSFRPGVRGPNAWAKSNWTVATMISNMGIFRNDLDLSTMSGYSVTQRATRLAKVSAHHWSLSGAAENQDWAWAADAHRGYGEDWSIGWGYGRVVLHSNIPAAEKQAFARAICQSGIDLFCAIKAGVIWQPNGGWTHGRMLNVLLAGLLLNDQAMLDSVLAWNGADLGDGVTLLDPPWSEQKCYHFVTPTPRTDGRPAGGQWGIWTGSGGALQTIEERYSRWPFTADMVGLPHWIIDSYEAGSNGFQAANLAMSYMEINYGSQIENAICTSLLNLPGGVSLTPLYPWLHWMDRIMSIQDFSYTVLGSASLGSTISLNRTPLNGPFGSSQASRRVALYKSVQNSGHLNRAAWAAGVPEICMPPVVTVDGTTITVVAAPFEYAHGAAIIRRDMRWSQDNGATWTVLADVPATHTFAVPAGMTETLVGVRVANATGNGPWSSNRPRYDLSATPANTLKSGMIVTGEAPVPSIPNLFAFDLRNEAGSATITDVPALRVSINNGAWQTLADAGLTVAQDVTGRLRLSGAALAAMTAGQNIRVHYEQEQPGEPYNLPNTVSAIYARATTAPNPANSTMPGLPLTATIANEPVTVTK